MNTQDRQIITEIIQKLVEGNKEWFYKKGINVAEKSGFWILNYQQDFDFKLGLPHNRYTRGTVIKIPEPGFNINTDPLTLLVSLPFIRFFNLNEYSPENETNPIPENSTIVEKLDGNLVGIRRYNNELIWHTRKMISTHQPDMELKIRSFEKTGKCELLQIIGEYVKEIPMPQPNLALYFEFIHPNAKIITIYPETHTGLHLIGARNMKTLQELTERELDTYAAERNLKRPRRFRAPEKFGEIQESIPQLLQTDGIITPEGFILHDNITNTRKKIKSVEYIEKHHMLGKISFKNLTPLYFKGEQNEIITYVPIAKEKFEEFDQIIQEKITELIQTTNAWIEEHPHIQESAIKLFDKKTNLPKQTKDIIINFQKNKPKEPRAFIKDKLHISYLKTGWSSFRDYLKISAFDLNQE